MARASVPAIAEYPDRMKLKVLTAALAIASFGQVSTPAVAQDNNQPSDPAIQPSSFNLAGINNSGMLTMAKNDAPEALTMPAKAVPKQKTPNGMSMNMGLSGGPSGPDFAV